MADGEKLETIGAAFLSIVPTFEGGIAKLATEIELGLTAVGVPAGRKLGRSLGEGAAATGDETGRMLGEKIKSGLSSQTVSIANTFNRQLDSEIGGAKATRMGESFGGRFASGIKVKLASIGKSIEESVRRSQGTAKTAGTEFGASFAGGAKGSLSTVGKFANESISSTVAHARESGTAAGTAYATSFAAKAKAVSVASAASAASAAPVVAAVPKGGAEKVNEAAKPSRAAGFAKTAGGAAGLIGGFEVAKFTGESIKGAMELDKNVQTLKNANHDEHMSNDQLREIMLSLSKQTGESLHGVYEGMYSVEKAGYHGKDAADVLLAGLKGAADEGADPEEVIQGLTTVMHNSGKSAKDAPKVMNMLVAAAGSTKSSLQSLMSSLSNVMPTASQLGVSPAEALSMTSMMTRQGFTPQRATMDANHAILSMVNPNTHQAHAMSTYGMAAGDISDSITKRGVTKTLSMISDRIDSKIKVSQAEAKSLLAEMSPKARKLADEYKRGVKTSAQVDKAKVSSRDRELLHAYMPGASNRTRALAQVTGGNTSLQLALALSGKGQRAEAKHLTAGNEKALKDSKHLDEMFKKTTGTASMQFKLLGSHITAIGVAIATKVLPHLGNMAKKLNDLITKGEEFWQKNKKWLGPFIVDLGKVILLVGSVRLGLKALAAVKLKWNALKSGISALKTFSKESKTAKAAHKAIDGVKFLWRGLKAGIKNLGDFIRKARDSKAAHKAIDAAKLGWSSIKSGIKNLRDFIRKAADSKAAHKAIDAAKLGWSSIKSGISHVKDLTKNTKLAQGASKAFAAAQWLVNAALSANPIGLVVMAVAGLGLALVVAYKKSARFRKVVNGAFKSVKKGAQKVYDFFVSIFGKIKDFFTGKAGEMMVDGAMWIVKKFAGGLSAALGSLGGLGKKIAKWIGLDGLAGDDDKKSPDAGKPDAQDMDERARKSMTTVKPPAKPKAKSKAEDEDEDEAADEADLDAQFAKWDAEEKEREKAARAEEAKKVAEEKRKELEKLRKRAEAARKKREREREKAQRKVETAQRKRVREMQAAQRKRVREMQAAQKKRVREAATNARHAEAAKRQRVTASGRDAASVIKDDIARVNANKASIERKTLANYSQADIKHTGGIPEWQDRVARIKLALKKAQAQYVAEAKAVAAGRGDIRSRDQLRRHVSRLAGWVLDDQHVVSLLKKEQTAQARNRRKAESQAAREARAAGRAMNRPTRSRRLNGPTPIGRNSGGGGYGSDMSLSDNDIKRIADAVERGAEHGTATGIQKREAAQRRNANHRMVVGR